MISNNNELYSMIRDLIEKLKKEGEVQWGIALLESLSISTLSGEILGEIRLNLQKLKATNVVSRLSIGTEVDDALRYLNSVLGPAR